MFGKLQRNILNLVLVMDNIIDKGNMAISNALLTLQYLLI